MGCHLFPAWQRSSAVPSTKSSVLCHVPVPFKEPHRGRNEDKVAKLLIISCRLYVDHRSLTEGYVTADLAKRNHLLQCGTLSRAWSRLQEKEGLRKYSGGEGKGGERIWSAVCQRRSVHEKDLVTHSVLCMWTVFCAVFAINCLIYFLQLQKLALRSHLMFLSCSLVEELLLLLLPDPFGLVTPVPG